MYRGARANVTPVDDLVTTITSATTTSYADDAVSPDTTYYYAVSTVDAAEQVTRSSNEAAVYVPATGTESPTATVLTVAGEPVENDAVSEDVSGIRFTVQASFARGATTAAGGQSSWSNEVSAYAPTESNESPAVSVPVGWSAGRQGIGLGERTGRPSLDNDCQEGGGT